MIFARAVAIACLKVLGWLLYATALLVLVMLFINWWGGDPTAKLALLALAAFGLAFGGALAHRFAKVFENMN